MSVGSPAPAGPVLRGLWLAGARLAWLLVAGATVAVFTAGLPAAFRQLGVPCASLQNCTDFRLYPEDVRMLEQAGLSLQFYNVYGATLTLLALALMLGAAAVLFWRRTSTRMAVFISFGLLLLGPAVFNNITGPLVRETPAWAGLVSGLRAMGLWVGLVSYYLFPNGRFVPRWARPMVVVIAATALIFSFPSTLTGLGLPERSAGPLLSAELPVLFAAGLLAQVYRYRAASTPVERQQTKWMVLAFSVYALDEMVYLGQSVLAPLPQPGLPHLLRSLGGGTLNIVFVALLPVALTIAILRYRLWDVDLLIRRTLVYGLLTTVLGLMYFGSVLGLQALFRGLVGANSNATIVLSVLAIAALAAPLRRRVQVFIDRRFYRSQYDAAQVLAAFGASLRSDASADLQKLTDDLLDVVDGTLRPEHTSLWLRPPK